MIGVVLWCDQADRKAVIWCDDNGDLAFYHDKDGGLDPTGFFDAGDMVQFEVDICRNLRQAKNARLVQEHAFSGLPERLKNSAGMSDSGTAQVLPFAPRKITGNMEPALRKA